MTWYVGNVHIYKEIYIPRHLALENEDNRALNTLAEYDHNNPINRKRAKTRFYTKRKQQM